MRVKIVPDTSLLAASSINTQGWTGPERRGDFLSRPWSNIDFIAGQRQPLTMSDTAADTESSPAKQYRLLKRKYFLNVIYDQNI